jgi:hypothetical protein
VKTAASLAVRLLVTLSLLTGAGTASAEETSGEEGEAREAKAKVEPPLAVLPRPPDTHLDEPTAEDRQLLDQLLERLTTSQGGDRLVVLGELLDVDAALLPALRARLDGEAGKANRALMKKLLLDTRKKARGEVERAMHARGEKGDVETPDYLPLMLSHPKPDSPDWVGLVHVLAISRMCVQLGTVEAVRVLLHVYVRFEFLRIDTQLQLKKLGDKSLAALIETTRHKASTVSQWAKRRLDFLGKAIPSEVVQVEDPQILADVLRAYGRTRDPDAARLVISFANSERVQVRESARQAVSMFGETANWSLRDTYENMVGKKPPREWSWDRTARELFREFDRIRLAELYDHYQRGLTARDHGDLEKMREAFDQVVARAPDFEPKDKLIEAYLAYADKKFDDAPDHVETSLQRVLRLTDDPSVRQRAESLLLTREAQRLAEANIADSSLLRRAVDLDPSNSRAKRLLEDLSREPFTEQSGFARVLWPALLGAFAVAFALIVAFWRRRKAPKDRN